MTFLAFLIAMYCVSSAADLARFVTENPRMELPLRGPVRVLFYFFAVPMRIPTEVDHSFRSMWTTRSEGSEPRIPMMWTCHADMWATRGE
jgi:hypothetical protein